MKYLIYILPVLVIALFGYLFFGMEQGSERATEKAATTEAKSGLEAQTNSEGAISITVTPEVLGSGATEWRFKVAFDTHSGSLDHSPLAIATLFDDKGNAYKPIAWEGPGSGGHHREGVLVFRAIDHAPRAVELRIADVGGIPERSFRWSIE